MVMKLGATVRVLGPLDRLRPRPYNEWSVTHTNHPNFNWLTPWRVNSVARSASSSSSGATGTLNSAPGSVPPDRPTPTANFDQHRSTPCVPLPADAADCSYTTLRGRTQWIRSMNADHISGRSRYALQQRSAPVGSLLRRPQLPVGRGHGPCPAMKLRRRNASLWLDWRRPLRESGRISRDGHGLHDTRCLAGDGDSRVGDPCGR